MLLGQFGVGKSTILNRMAQTSECQTLVAHRFVQIAGKQLRLDFHDTHGTEARVGSLFPTVMRNTDLCFLVYKDQETFEALQMWRVMC